MEAYRPVKQFYSALGFRVVREDVAEGKAAYLVMERQGAILCFWPGNNAVHDHPYFQTFPPDTPPGYRVEIVIAVKDLDALYLRAQQMEAVDTAIKEKPWGVRDFRIIDPNGIYIRFSEPHDPRQPSARPARGLNPSRYSRRVPRGRR